MPTMNVSLPEGLKAVVDEAVGSGRYASASDYVRDLIRKDEEIKQKRAEFIRLIREGEESGISEQSVEEIFAEARAEAIERGYKD
ncbi:antitoxin protein parD-4 [Marinicauda pacifica]|jgi:antitoxin ParD1/3/4|uniref:Type II toxin-antitoxin system ParD family antitoxin n=1 Tax=Marinicauda pacifica TaxID=1133559 RepID=A0A4S2HCR8_9PROT|nr:MULTISPECIES: type II toxin-antitoxin system ParD family antitoxin [Marinicauda]TGY93845.1 type II toxin-antitoxin system ParD family antitoxin [Marinicauda pacifica]GGE30797.1 antitoxin protein parD-4 [Marinicauda pacifica]